MQYAIEHNGMAYTPDDAVPDLKHVAEYNKALEEKELAWLQTHPEKITLYVRHSGWQGVKGSRRWSHSGQLTTWLGTVICERCWVGPQKRAGFQGNFGSTRAAIDAVIFGVRYVGWYFDSTGNYCRLRKAKRQK